MKGLPAMLILNSTQLLKRSGLQLGNALKQSVVTLLFIGIGCAPVVSEKDQPMGYDTIEKLRARLEQVAQYGDGGSSLAGIPESIEELMDSDTDKAKTLLSDFNRLNTAGTRDARKKIALEMVVHLK
jgi:hypothetical protein